MLPVYVYAIVSGAQTHGSADGQFVDPPAKYPLTFRMKVVPGAPEPDVIVPAIVTLRVPTEPSGKPIGTCKSSNCVS